MHHELEHLVTDVDHRPTSRQVGELVRRGRVGQREQHTRERDAVGDAVVQAREHRRAACVTLDQMDLPQRHVARQRQRDLLGDVLLQLRVAARRRQARVDEVIRHVEVTVRPPRPAQQPALHHALPEAGEAVDEPFLQQAFDRTRRRKGIEREHAVDDHQVLGPVHPQPGGVGGRHRLRGHGTSVRSHRPRHLGRV